MDELLEKEVALENRCIVLLEILENKFDFYSAQDTSYLESGKVIINGVAVSLDSVDHRVLFDHYEMLFINTFKRFAEFFVTNLNSPLIAFPSRTFIDMGYRIAPVLFSDEDDVSLKQKLRYKAMVTLKDILFLGMSSASYKREYAKLFSDVKSHLKAEDLKALEKAERNSNFKKLSFHIDKNVKPNAPSIDHGLLQEPILNIFYLHYSDMLHSGSLIALGMNINPDHYKRQRVFATTLMLEATLAVLTSICTGDTSKKLENKILEEYQSIKEFYQNLYTEVAALYREMFMV